MSLPREILDQLLSGYMDDALSNDERARVEQLLRDDAEVAREFRELTELRETLREIHRIDQQPTLKPGFADRVLKATVDQGATEGLSEEHPVMMLTQQPSTRVTRQGMPVGKIAGVLVALAASTIVAVAVLRTPDPVPGEGELAENSPPPVHVDPVVPPPEPSPIEPESPRTPDPIEQIVQSTNTDNDSEQPRETPDVVEMPDEPVKVTPENLADLLNSPDFNVKNLNLDGISDKDLRSLVKANVLVLDVRQTEQGRQSNAVGTAMAKAGLEAADQKQINEDIVGYGKQLSNADDSVSVLFLQGRAKKLDNFINRMVLDLDGIESVGFKLVNDVPIVGVAKALELDELNPDAIRSIRHSVSWQLTDETGNSVQVLAHELSSRKFKPLKRNGKPGLAELIAAGGNDGLDVNSRIFVLVR